MTPSELAEAGWRTLKNHRWSRKGSYIEVIRIDPGKVQAFLVSDGSRVAKSPRLPGSPAWPEHRDAVLYELGIQQMSDGTLVCEWALKSATPLAQKPPRSKSKQNGATS